MKRIFFMAIGLFFYGQNAQSQKQNIESEHVFISEVSFSELEKNYVTYLDLKTPLGVKSFRIVENSSATDYNSKAKYYSGNELNNEANTINIFFEGDFYLVSVVLDGKNYSLSKRSDFRNSGPYQNIFDSRLKNHITKTKRPNQKDLQNRIYKQLDEKIISTAIGYDNIWVEDALLGTLSKELNVYNDMPEDLNSCDLKNIDNDITKNNVIQKPSVQQSINDKDNVLHTYFHSLGYIGKSDIFVHLYNYNDEVSNYDLNQAKIKIIEATKGFRPDVRFVFVVHDSRSDNFTINKSNLPWDWSSFGFLDSFSTLIDNNEPTAKFDNNYHMLLIRASGFWIDGTSGYFGRASFQKNRAVSSVWGYANIHYQIPVHELSHNLHAQHSPTFYSACIGYWTWTGDTMQSGTDFLFCPGHRHQPNINTMNWIINRNTIKDEIQPLKLIDVKTPDVYWFRGNLNNFLYYQIALEDKRSTGRLFDGQAFTGFREAQIPNVSGDNISVNKIRTTKGSGTYTFETDYSNFDTVLYILDHNGNMIASDDDSGKRHHSKIEVYLNGGQDYYMIVQAYLGNRESEDRHPQESVYYLAINKQNSSYNYSINDSSRLETPNGEIVLTADFGLNTDKKNPLYSEEEGKPNMIVYQDSETKNLFHVEMLNQDVISQIFCYNTLGQRILIHSKIEDNTIKFDLTNQTSGVYILQIKTTTGETFTERVIVR